MAVLKGTIIPLSSEQFSKNSNRFNDNETPCYMYLFIPVKYGTIIVFKIPYSR